MPIYTYRCENCGTQFERQLKFTDPHPTTCPECAQESLRRVYQAVGIVFKGSGFYATDHRSPSGQSSRSTKAGEGESKPASESSTSSSSDSSSSPGSSSSSSAE